MIIAETSEQGKTQESTGFSPPPHSETRCHLVITALQLIGIYSWQVLLGVSAGRGKVMVGWEGDKGGSTLMESERGWVVGII